MFIEDEELRDIFKTASEDHLQKLDDGLLYLEKNPDDQAKIEELLREAHSLKGDAGMLGVKDVSTLAHQIEHILGSVKRGETPLNAAISDRLYHGLDAIRQLVREAVTGEPSNINTFYALAYMMGASESSSKGAGEQQNIAAESQPSELAEEEAIVEATQDVYLLSSEYELTNTVDIVSDAAIESPTAAASSIEQESVPSKIPEEAKEFQTSVRAAVETEQPSTKPAPAKLAAGTEALPLQNSKLSPSALPASVSQPVVQKDPSTSRFAIESVRVETRHLDSLMTQAGELTVTKIRLSRRLTEIEELVNLCEDWSRETSVNRFFIAEVNSGFGIGNGSNSDFYSSRNGGNDGGHKTHEKGLKQFQNLHHRVQERLELVSSLVTKLRNAIYEDNARLEAIASELSDGIRTLRLLPLATIFNLFPRMVRDLAKQEGKQVELAIEGTETKADKRIIEEMKDPLMHMIRNAIDHGIETPEERQRLGKPTQAKIQIQAYQTATNVIIEVKDDGRGLDIEKIKQTAIKRGVCRPEEIATMTPNQIQSLIIEPGFSTRTFVTEVSGRGVGLDVVRTNVEMLKGSIQVESKPGLGCAIRVQLPTTLATAHVLIVAVMGISYAIPVESVQMARFIAPNEIFTIEGRDTILLDSQPVSIARLADLLELGIGDPELAIAHSQSSTPCIILKVGDEKVGLMVDALVDEQDVMLKPQSQLLKRVRNVSGATILGTGEVCMVLNPQDLIKSVRKQAVSAAALPTPNLTPSRKQVILLVEDSISTRTQEKRILEGAGYEVVTAVDGLDGWNKLKTRSFDAVVSDVQMPNLDGLSLTNKIRQQKEYTELPIILVTSLASDEDKRRGAQAGANAYITKGTFNQEVLLDTLRRLV